MKIQGRKRKESNRKVIVRGGKGDFGWRATLSRKLFFYFRSESNYAKINVNATAKQTHFDTKYEWQRMKRSQYDSPCFIYTPTDGPAAGQTFQWIHFVKGVRQHWADPSSRGSACEQNPWLYKCSGIYLFPIYEIRVFFFFFDRVERQSWLFCYCVPFLVRVHEHVAIGVQTLVPTPEGLPGLKWGKRTAISCTFLNGGKWE